MASEYTSSPVAQPATQMRIGDLAGRSLISAGNDLLLQRLERLRVAEELRDADEEVLVQVLDLAGVVPQDGQVVGRGPPGLRRAIRRRMRRRMVVCL